jgi:hypothetical protein
MTSNTERNRRRRNMGKIAPLVGRRVHEEGTPQIVLFKIGAIEEQVREGSNALQNCRAFQT